MSRHSNACSCFFTFNTLLIQKMKEVNFKQCTIFYITHHKCFLHLIHLLIEWMKELVLKFYIIFYIIHYMCFFTFNTLLIDGMKELILKQNTIFYTTDAALINLHVSHTACVCLKTQHLDIFIL